MGSAAPELAPSSPLRIGSVAIVERLAVGGMAEVFLGARAGEAVVVKVLLPQHAKQPEVVALFEHEAALGARLAHARLVPVLEHGMSALGPYLVSPFVAGLTLAELAAEPLSYAAVLCVAADLSEALAFLHEARDEAGALDILHRDISPDNAIVDGSGRVRLIDLGIAKSALRTGRTKTGVVRGKVAYAAPELVTGSSVDARADLYSAAVVVFELATGVPYLDGDSEVALLRKAEEPPLRVPSSLGADARLDAPLARALARFPEERFTTARQMHEAFASLLADADAEGEGRAELVRRVGSRAEPPAVPTPPAPERTKLDTPAVASAAAPSFAARPSARYARLLPIAGGALVVGALALYRWAQPSAPPPAWAAGAPFAEARVTASEVASASVAEPPRSASPSSLDTAPSSLDAAPDAASVTSEGDPSASSSSTASARASAKPPAPSSSVITSAAASASSAPSSSAAPAASAPPKAVDRASVQAKMAEVNRRIAAAKAEGKDVSAAEARIPAALDAYMDGRYEQSNRELDAISASLNR